LLKVILSFAYAKINNYSKYVAYPTKFLVTKGEEPLLTPPEAWNDVQEFADFFPVLYPTKASQQHLERLVLAYLPKGILVHDFEIAAIALANGIDKIATFNKSDFQTIGEIEVMVPR
jgi:predicted nucleic acid-binding protein